MHPSQRNLARVATLVVAASMAVTVGCSGNPSATDDGGTPPGPTHGDGGAASDGPVTMLDPDSGPPVIPAPDPHAMMGAPWSSPGTWGGAVPGRDSEVTIPVGRTITLDTDACVRTLDVRGTLVFADRDTTLCARWIMVHHGGRLVVGTADRRFTHRAVITLIDGDRNEDIMGMGTKFLGVMDGGRIDLHGLGGFTAWTTLNGATPAGASTIEVVDATGWRVGDQIVIATGSADPDHTEVRRLTAVTANRLTLDAPLVNARPGTLRMVEGRTLDMRASVARLSRNIVIQGDEASAMGNFGGHTMVMPRGVALVDGVEFVRMGQFDRLARYPFHWHLAGNVTGQYIRNSVVNRSFQRGIVVHSVQGAFVQNNVVFDSMGHNFIIETPDTTGTLMDRNLAITNRIALHTQGTLVSQNDNEAAGFWIRGARNAFTNNVSAGSAASGFWYDNTDDGPTQFRNNIAYAAAARGQRADFIRESGLFLSNVNAGMTLEVQDSFFYHNRVGTWPTEDGQQIYRAMTYAENATDVTSETTGQRGFARFIAPVFVGALDGVARGGGALRVQYGSTLEAVDPVFVNYGSNSIIGSNDINLPWMADFRIRNARLVNTQRNALGLPDVFVAEFFDDTFQPRGFYVPVAYPMLANAAMTRRRIATGDDMQEVFYSPTRVAYGVLTTMLAGARRFADRSAGGTYSDYQNVPVRRSDGLEYAFRQGFVFGYPVICNTDLSYQLTREPTDTMFALSIGFDLAFQSDSPLHVRVAVPLAAAPRRVLRLRNGGFPDLELDRGTMLTAAPNLAEFTASPADRYFYDSAARILHVTVTAPSLLVER